MNVLKKISAIVSVICALMSPALATQNTYVMPLVGPHSMADVMTTLNAGLLSMNQCHSGTTAPTNGPGSAPSVFQCWADTTSNPTIFKSWDGTAWAAFGNYDTTAHTWTPIRQGTALGTASVQNIGTSGANVALMNALNTWSAVQTFSNGLSVSIGIYAPAGGIGFFVSSGGAAAGVSAAYMEITDTYAGNAPTNGIYAKGGAAGNALFKSNSAATTPAAGNLALWYDSTDLRLHDKNPSGAIGTTSVAQMCSSNNWFNGMSAAGVYGCSQPSFASLTSSLACSQTPALTGDVTTSAGSCATSIGISATRGVLMTRGASGWTALGPCTLGQRPVFGGSGVDMFCASQVPVDVTTVGAKCDWNGTTGTNDQSAIQTALNTYKSILIPGNCAISTSLTFGNLAYASIIGLNSALSTSNANSGTSVLVATNANLPAITVVSTIPGLLIRGVGITRSVTATSGGDGIKFNGFNDNPIIDNVEVQKQYVGIRLTGAGYGELTNSFIHNNVSDNVLCDGTTMTLALQCQWYMGFNMSQSAGGWNYRVVAPATAAISSQLLLGTWTENKSFSGGLGGASFEGNGNVSVQGVRATGGFYGTDAGPEWNFDTYNTAGGEHMINATFAEINTVGPCIVISANNAGGIALNGNTITGCKTSGISNAATSSINVVGGLIKNNTTFGIVNSGSLQASAVNMLANISGPVSNSGTYYGTANIPASANSGPLGATSFAAPAGTVGEIWESVCSLLTNTVTITNASPAVVTWAAAHQMTPSSVVNGIPTAICPLTLSNSGGGLPSPLAAATIYYAKVINTTQFNLATSVANAIAGTFINTTTAGSGTQSGYMGTQTTVAGQGTPFDMTGMGLPAGDWDITCGSGWSTVSGVPFINYLTQWVGLTANTFNSTVGQAYTMYGGAANVPNNIAGGSVLLSTPTVHKFFSSTTNVFCGSQVGFSNTGVVDSIPSMRADRRR